MHFSDGSRNGGGGEPVTIVAAHLILTLAEVEVVILQMLIAQATLDEHLAKLPAVLNEDRCRFLIDLCVGGLDGHIVGSLESIGIRAMIVSVLAANGEVTLQYGITEDQFRGPEIIGAVGIALDNAVNGGCADNRRLLRSAAWRLGVIEKSINVQVDTQLSHLTIVIGVEDVLLDTLILPDVTCRALCEDAVLEHICQVVALCLAFGRTVEFVVGAKGVILIDHIV